MTDALRIADLVAARKRKRAAVAAKVARFGPGIFRVIRSAEARPVTFAGIPRDQQPTAGDGRG